MINEFLIFDIQSLVNLFIQNQKLNMTDYQYQSLIVHLAIAVNHIRKGQFIDQKIDNNALHPLTHRLVNDLSEHFSLIVPNLEKQYLNVHIEGIISKDQMCQSQMKMSRIVPFLSVTNF